MALIAAQMYTLRELCKKPKDIAKACAEVKKMGYDGIQSSGMGPIAPKSLRKILDGEGLVCAATHIPLSSILEETDKVIEDHQILGCKNIAIGGFFPQTKEGVVWNRALWYEFIDKFNAVAPKFEAAGMRIGYHNHSHEFAPAEGMRPMDMLLNRLEGATWLEIDTFWVARGGCDPAAYIEKAAGRIPCVHFKDMTITTDREYKMCEVGDGNLNWPRILQACRYAGVRWHIVERDSGDMEPFESLRRSIHNLRENMGL